MKRINITKLNITLWGIIVIVVIVLAFRLCKATEGSMKEIGEWEFLSIDDEELVDTTRKGFLRDDKLVRIYYGKLSLGLNMHKTGPKWVEKRGDSTIVTLPPIELLDNNFIDEARTKAFIETGDWTDADRENMYHTAYNKMLRRCMTKENIQTAQTNAEQQFGKMLKALGVEKYTIRWNTEK